MTRQHAKLIALIILAASLVVIIGILASRLNETSAPVASPDPAASRVSGEWIGAIIGADYTPPASESGSIVAPTPIPPAVPPPTPLPADYARLDRSRMGIQAHYNFDVAGWDRTLHQIAALRVGWIKMQAAWNWLQPDSPGQFDQNFRLFQLHVQEADKRGFNVLLSIAKAPAWARNINRNEDGPPDDLAQFAAFIRLLLEKIGPYIDAIEIWNEPNLKREWTGNRAFNGAGYMELFRVGYDAVRAYSPAITIITAGLAPTGNAENVSVNDRSFLQQMYSAGLAGYPDAVIGIHPYSWGNPPDFLCCDNIDGQGWDDRPQFFFRQNIQDYRQIIAANGDDAPMWATEFGWATWQDYPGQPPDIWMNYNSPIDQMNYALRAFQIGQARQDIGVMILWNLSYANETIIQQGSELAGYSLLYPSFDGSGALRQRPLYDALVNRP